jgi:hypothetical protein
MKAKLKKDWYGRDKSAEELHEDSKNWNSEIEFIHIEMRFLNNLLASKYIDFLEYDLEKETKKLASNIKEEKRIGNELHDLIVKHENSLADLIQTNSVKANTHYKDIHKKLESEMLFYTKKYRKVKRQIFKLVEEIMKKKAQKKLMGS